MKVREIIKRINCARLPVFLQEDYMKVREVVLSDYAGCSYPEENATVTSISIDRDRIIIHYKQGR